MNTSRKSDSAPSAKAQQVSRRRDIFLALNRRAMDLAASDDIAPARSLAASASAMIADAVTRLAELEAASGTMPAPTPDAAPRLKLVGSWDEAA